MKKEIKKMMKTLTLLEKIFGLWINALISIVLCWIFLNLSQLELASM